MKGIEDPEIGDRKKLKYKIYSFDILDEMETKDILSHAIDSVIDLDIQPEGFIKYLLSHATSEPEKPSPCEDIDEQQQTIVSATVNESIKKIIEMKLEQCTELEQLKEQRKKLLNGEGGEKKEA